MQPTPLSPAGRGETLLASPPDFAIMSGTAVSTLDQAMSPAESRLAHRASRHIKEKIIE